MFEHLQKKEVSGSATCWLEIPDLSPDARIEVKFAGESNRAYYNEVLRRAGSRARQLATREVTVKDVVKLRDDDRELFGKFILVNWDGVEDADGNPVPFTREYAMEFCEKVPYHIFDKIRNWAGQPERFLQDDESPDVEA
ncbi:MAG: hypothetical protein R3282_04970, partial [Rhodothermales bacterium]|nr:hypothetical protein [Rhodothermales bacterium]